MAQTFIVNNTVITNLTDATFQEETSNYWGTDVPIVFIIHVSEIDKLLKKGGYIGVRIIDIEDPKEVRVKWFTFSLTQEAEYRAKDTNDFFYFLKANVIDSILQSVLDPINPKILVLRLLKDSNNVVHAFFSAGVLIESGIGTGSPSAGAKVP